jgi:CubicO group peptidase (beta-lactamase class C family)
MALPRPLPRPLAALALLALDLAACGGSGDDASPLYDVSDAPARYRAVAEAFAQEARLLGAPGAALGIVENGELVYAVGVGRQDPRGGVRTAPTTLFRIGSLTKMMTALAVLQEVEAGSVALDDAVVAHVPGFHLDGDDVSAVTVRQLLDHATGLFDYLEIDAPASEQDDAALEAFLTGRFAGLGYLMAPPGRFYDYSNPNYMLAGLVAEKASGVPYRQLMAERVFGPLGMSRTFFLASEVLADGDFAVALTTPDPAHGVPGLVEPASYDNPWARPAGYAWSSVGDLARFARFLLAGDEVVLSPALHAVMTSPTRDTQELLDLIHYGFGLATIPGFFWGTAFYPTKVIQHAGALRGFSSSLFLLPELGFGVVTLASGDGAAFPATLDAALRLPALPAPVAGPDVTPDPATFAEETGLYVDPHLAGEVTVSLSSGQLRVDVPAAAGLGITYDPVLQPVSPRNFFLTVEGVPLLVTFIHGGAGEPTWLRTRVFVAARPPPGVLASPPPAPSPAAATRLRAALRALR